MRHEASGDPAPVGRGTPQPLSALPRDDLAGVLTDVDGTLTTDGLLTPGAFAALWRLKSAGLRVIPVTGRSAGWAHMMIRSWPVDAVVAESGGLWLARDAATGRTECRMHADTAQVAADRARLAARARDVLAALPGLAPSSDDAYRLVDLALDHAEEVPPAGDAVVARALAMFRAAGFSARASSIHVNAWAGDFDKASTALRCLRERFPDAADPARWAFIGDAPNDESMFEAFDRSAAVADIAPHLAGLAHRPAFVTEARGGAGFEEFVARVLGG